MKDGTNLYPMPGFCERLIQARKAAGLKQEALARKANISLSTYRYYEYGIRIPTLTIISKIAVILKVSLDWLAYGKE